MKLGRNRDIVRIHIITLVSEISHTGKYLMLKIVLNTDLKQQIINFKKKEKQDYSGNVMHSI